MQAHPEPLFLADDGTFVDVTDFVRFELDHGDIRYGVLDLIVTFVYRGGGESVATCFTSSRLMQSKKTYTLLSPNGQRGLNFRQHCSNFGQS